MIYSRVSRVGRNAGASQNQNGEQERANEGEYEGNLPSFDADVEEEKGLRREHSCGVTGTGPSLGSGVLCHHASGSILPSRAQMVTMMFPDVS